MRQRPLRLIAIAATITLVAVVGAVSLDGATGAGAVTVHRGDTLWDLSRRYHVSLGRLASSNHLQVGGVLPVGRSLVIPGQTPSAPVASRTTKAASSQARAVKTSKTKAASLKTAAKAISKAIPGSTAAKAVPARTAVASAGPTGGTAAYTAAALAQMRSFCVNYRAPSGAGGLPSALKQHPERLALRPLFIRWAQAYGVSPSLIQAIAWQESGWQNDVVSSANAQGIGQLLPTTATFVSGSLLGLNLKLTVASDNIQMMVRFFAYLLKAAGGNQCVAVASYYQGFGAFQQVGVLPQSQTYVRSVFTLRSRFA
ncbi:MAG TPA: transglycosylase SLT domain-containing protein [Acidimicrobiales bacterium]|jgi:LysM repeat protein